MTHRPSNDVPRTRCPYQLCHVFGADTLCGQRRRPWQCSPGQSIPRPCTAGTPPTAGPLQRRGLLSLGRTRHPRRSLARADRGHASSGDVDRLRPHRHHSESARRAEPGVPRDAHTSLDESGGKGDRGNGERPNALILDVKESGKKMETLTSIRCSRTVARSISRYSERGTHLNSVLTNRRPFYLPLLREGEDHISPTNSFTRALEMRAPLVIGAVAHHRLKSR